MSGHKTGGGRLEQNGGLFLLGPGLKPPLLLLLLFAQLFANIISGVMYLTFKCKMSVFLVCSCV